MSKILDPPSPAAVRALTLFRRSAAALAEYRKATGLKQSDIATALGVSLVAVSHWETGRSLPSGNRAALYVSAVSRAAREAAARLPTLAAALRRTCQ